MYLDFYKNFFFIFFCLYYKSAAGVWEELKKENTNDHNIYNSYAYHLLGVHLFSFFFFFFWSDFYVSIVYAFFFFRRCNMTFLSIKDFELFLVWFLSPIVLLSYQSIVICYNKSQNNQTLTSFQFQWQMSALGLATPSKVICYGWNMMKLKKKNYWLKNLHSH